MMRDCTCVGSCRGAEGLGAGWNCVVDNGSVEDARIGPPSARSERPRELNGPASGAQVAVDERSTERATAESTGTLERLALADKRITLLRNALVGLVGVDTRAELEELEAAMRLMPAPAQDKAATIDAIHALLATQPEREKDA